MIITLKDGSKKEYDRPMSVIEIAKDLSEGLARMAAVGEMDGEIVDLRHIVDRDCSLNSTPSPTRKVLRHTPHNVSYHGAGC